MKTMKLIVDLFEMFAYAFMGGGVVMMYVTLTALINSDELGMQYFNITAYAMIAFFAVAAVLFTANTIMVMIDRTITNEED